MARKIIKAKKVTSDLFFKRVMSYEVVARDFLEEHLDEDTKFLLDLSDIRVEKDSHVSEDLKERLSDLIYSVKTKGKSSYRAYVIIEHQSKPDSSMPLRIWNYILLICDRYKKKGAKKLPLIIPIVFYNGKMAYNAPKTLWEMFSETREAERVISKRDMLVDLSIMDNTKFKSQKHIGLFNFFMKNIHRKDMLEVWQEALTEFKDSLLKDPNQLLYLKEILWYTGSRVPADQKEMLNQLVAQSLSKQEGVENMITIADSYVQEGYKVGLQEGKMAGLQEGKMAGLQEGKMEVALKMVQAGLDVDFISHLTGVRREEIAIQSEESEEA